MLHPSVDPFHKAAELELRPDYSRRGNTSSVVSIKPISSVSPSTYVQEEKDSADITLRSDHPEYVNGSSGVDVQIAPEAKQHSGSANSITIETSKGSSKSPPQFKIRLNRKFSKLPVSSHAPPKTFSVSHSSGCNNVSPTADLAEFFYAENENFKMFMDTFKNPYEKESFLTQLHTVGENKWKRWRADLKTWVPEKRVPHRNCGQKRTKTAKPLSKASLEHTASLLLGDTSYTSDIGTDPATAVLSETVANNCISLESYS
jgi:hypothetical protein